MYHFFANVLRMIILAFWMRFGPVLRERYSIQIQAVTVLAGIVLFGIVIIFYESDRIKKRRIIEALQRQLRLCEEDRRESRLRQHEFKKELQALRAMAAGESSLLQEKLLQQEQEEIYQELQPVLRGIVRGYRKALWEEQIELRLTATGFIPHFRIEDGDMISLVGNLIDNAIEAVRELPRQERWLELELGEEDGQQWLCVSNPYQKEETPSDGLMEQGVSSKGSGRGNGLYIVREIVRKYRGEIRIIRDKYFNVRIAWGEM